LKKRGIFIKVFTYTAILLVILVCVTVALFSRQFLAFYSTSRMQQLNFAYQDLYVQLQKNNGGDIVGVAREFYKNNQSFSFYIKENDDLVIFSTPNIDPDNVPDTNNFRVIMTIDQRYTLYAISRETAATGYGGLVSRSLIALVCILALSLAGAYIFARRITTPIKWLAAATKKMADREDVPPAPRRNDELGELATDVHVMYEQLKATIAELEDEVLREREMEETQRHFFSAASHELKTPVAAISVLLEGMLENVGDYKNHNKYLRECLKLVDAQSAMIREIIEIVGLNDGKIVLNIEKIDLGLAVDALLPSFQTLADANGQRIDVHIAPCQTCLADEKMLHKALSNVLLNAVQNTPSGGEIRIWSESYADQHRLCVLNTGVGIDPAVLPKLFEPFYRMDRTRRGKNGNSGLGLTIVKKALDAMNMEFSLDNTDGGVLFWVDLPEI